MAKVTVKICGLTNYDDAALAVECGADYIGFIFAGSPRRVEEKEVAAILHDLRGKGLLKNTKTVGVFVNEDPGIINRIIRHTGIDLVQFHGDETPDMVNTFPTPWYKALRIQSKEDVDRQIRQAGKNWNSQSLLVDTAVKGIYGGTGKTLATDIACFACESVKSLGKKFILAGGINPDNVGELIKTVQPDGIDVGSGVEESKGKKSRGKMRELFERINK